MVRINMDLTAEEADRLEFIKSEAGLRTYTETLRHIITLFYKFKTNGQKI